MTFENFPSAQPPQLPKSNPYTKNIREILTGTLLAALLVTWGYIIWDKNKTRQILKETNSQLNIIAAEKDDLKKMLDDATQRYDMIKTSSAEMPHGTDSAIIKKNNEIEEKKNIINRLLANANASREQLMEAKRLILSLNDDIQVYKTQIETLHGEKLILAKEKIAIILEKEKIQKDYDAAKELIRNNEKTIDIGSTLHASNFNIIGINETKNGKEKETTTAKRVDKLRISFQIDENMISKSGRKEIYVSITAPNGLAVAVDELGSGTFKTREGEDKFYTNKVEINYMQGQIQTVSFDWKQNENFNTGEYKIEVFHNGFKIGEGYRRLKKGGLFG